MNISLYNINLQIPTKSPNCIKLGKLIDEETWDK